MSSQLPFSLFFSLLFATQIDAIIVDVQSGKVKCLTEDLNKGTLSYAQFRVFNASSSSHLTISSRVTGPNGETMHELNSVELGQFSFEAEMTGRYSTCFWLPKFNLSASVSVDVEWNSGIRLMGLNNVVKNGDLQAMEKELKKLGDYIKLIHGEMIFLRDREAESRRLHEETASKLSYFSLLSLLVCSAVAALQFWYLNSFFHSKKIL
ncbi:hypothetical protein LUZ60_013176 [Juncus effusus]|nr:hypothetical protein LUZ60_013176 [Juncus effusus]